MKSMNIVLLLVVLIGVFVHYFDELFEIVGGFAAKWLPEGEAAIVAMDDIAAPDYDLEKYWMALPHVDDFADVVPQKHETASILQHGDLFVDGQDEAKVDVFYVSPTSYFGWDWNAPVLRPYVSESIPIWNPLLLFADWIAAVTGQVHASVFNHVGRVYGPRYRQMSGLGFMTKNDKMRQKAWDLAYHDVRRAFHHYLAHWNHGRPFILSGHSQGSAHLARLLKEEIATNEALRKQLVVAYLIAAPITRKDVGVPVCETAKQTGCVAGYNVFLEGGDSSKYLLIKDNHDDLICVNPLSWSIDDEYVPAHHNKGSRPIIYHLLPFGIIGGDLVPQAHSAQCKNGFLWTNEPKHLGFTHGVFPGRNYHGVETSFFFVNIRANAKERVQAFHS